MAIGGKIREAFSNKGEILSFINKIESEKLAILVHFLNSLDKDRLNSFWNGITLASEDDAISFINKLTNPSLSNEERLRLCKAFKVIDDSILYTAAEGLNNLRTELEKRLLPQKLDPGAGILKKFFHWFKNLY